VRIVKHLISDRGTSFTSEIFKEFLKNKNIEHVLTAVSTPRANGQVERFNRILPMLAKLSETLTKWDQVLDKVEHSLNTICRTINEIPLRLLFGVNQKGI